MTFFGKYSTHRALLSVIAHVLVLFVSHATVFAGDVGQRLPYGDIARLFAARVASYNLKEVAIDDSMSERTLALYLAMLDGDRSIFLASDVASFKAWEHSLDDLVKNGDISPAFAIFKIYKERAEDRLVFVENMLTNSIDLRNGGTFVWKRKDVPWPADRTARNELWRKKILDQLIRRRVADDLSAQGLTNGVAHAMPTNFFSSATDNEAVIKQYRQFVTVLRDTDEDAIFQMFLSSVARSCDPHSDYMSPDTVEDFDISMRLSLTGIGAVLASEDGAAKVERIVPGGAADLDGRLKAGDKIIAVAEGDAEAVDIMHWPLSKAVRLIRGPKGRKVVLTVIPAAEPTRTVKIDIIRDEVRLEEQEARGKVHEVPSTGSVTTRVGVITLPGFYSDMKARDGGASGFKSSTRDVAALLREMKAAKVAGILLDLRNNGGGALEEAVDMTGLFISIGPVVQVRDRRNVTVMRDDYAGVECDGPLLVLVDRMSASASEILAAALQDYGRAIIVGDSRTHGKGTVQNVLPLRTLKESWGTMKVTTSGFYRFTGDSTQIKGVASDIIVRSPLDVMEVGEEYLDCALPWSRIAPVDFERSSSSGSLNGLLFWRISSRQNQAIRDLKPIIARLNVMSLDRRNNSAIFVARERLIDELKLRQADSTVTLDINNRETQAREEIKLGAMQAAEVKSLLEKSGVKETVPDVVLEEALAILSDYISLLGEE